MFDISSYLFACRGAWRWRDTQKLHCIWIRDLKHPIWWSIFDSIFSSLSDLKPAVTVFFHLCLAVLSFLALCFLAVTGGLTTP